MSIKISRKVKDAAFVAFELITLALAIGGFGWSDYADSKFWQIGWNVLGGLGIAGFVGGMWWKSQQKEPVKPEGQE